MIKRILWLTTDSTNPHQNLALEETLFDFVDDETLVFYLWQNQHTVVIGRNQNAIKECHVVDLAQDNGVLARRLSGGGAVYHDLGNLNFTFLMSTSNFDVEKQSQVLIEALRSFGIEAYARGRNDLLVDEKKFSGHAYYHHNQKSYHHGTLMVNVNLSELSKYLNVSKLKLQGKGVKSVISRVTNLLDYAEELTIENLKQSLLKAVEQVYQAPMQELILDEKTQSKFTEMTQKYSSKEWLLPEHFISNTLLEDRFEWGEISLSMEIKDNKISNIQVYTDAMDAFLASKLEDCLEDEIFSIQSIKIAIQSCDLDTQVKEDLISLFDTNHEEIFL